MNEIQRHERYKMYAIKSYYIKEFEKFSNDTKILSVVKNDNTGFVGYVLKENARIVIVYRGTNNVLQGDARTDINMAIRKKVPKQVTDALELFDRTRKAYPNTPINVTGHSLGGSLAQYVAVMRKVDEAVCFCPVGIEKSMKDYIFRYGVSAIKTPVSKIINYNNPSDILTTAYRNQLIGINYIIRSKNPLKDKHNLENMKPLSTRERVNSNYGNMRTEHSLYGEISSNGCAGTYSVTGYTRSDGTKVDGYTRTCGAKHLSMSMEERRAGQEKYKGKRFQDIPLGELEKAIGYFV